MYVHRYINGTITRAGDIDLTVTPPADGAPSEAQ
jgi:hypothetical protein